MGLTVLGGGLRLLAQPVFKRTPRVAGRLLR